MKIDPDWMPRSYPGAVAIKKGDNSGIKEILPGYYKGVPSLCENL
jgi:hypothetical protein